MNRGETVLETAGLTKRFRGGRGVEGVGFSLRRGDIYGLFGPNGAGKTTILKLIAGLLKPDGGSVRLFGHDPAVRFADGMSRVGMLIETPAAYEFMSAYRNLRQAARYYPGLPPARTDEVLELVGLAPYKHERVAGFSLGMKQRLGIAAALLSRPQLLLLDEPTNGLDIEGMIEMRELLRRLAAAESLTILLSSHLLGEMELLCSRAGILHEGRLVREGAAGELFGGSAPPLEQVFVETIREQRRGAAHASLQGQSDQ